MAFPVNHGGGNGAGPVSELHQAGVTGLEPGYQPIHLVQANAMAGEIFHASYHDLSPFRTYAHDIAG